MTLAESIALMDRVGAASAVAAATTSGLLRALAEHGGTAEELAGRTGLDARATALVLEVLRTLGIADRRGERFSPSAGLALLRDMSPPGGSLWGLWSHLGGFLSSGRASMLPRDGDGPTDRGRVYGPGVGYLAQLFETTAEIFADRLSGVGRVLDVGCGSGVWSLALAARDPSVHVTGLDLPPVLPSFEARALSLGLADRITALPGNMHDAELRGSYDTIVIANVLHLETADRARMVAQRLAPALAPGGRFVVVDALCGDDAVAAHARAVYALHLAMRVGTGHVHEASDIAGWLADVGLPRSELIPLGGPLAALGALVATGS